MKPRTKPEQTESVKVERERLRVQPDPYKIQSFCPDSILVSLLGDGTMIIHLEESFWFNDLEYLQEVAKVKLTAHHTKQFVRFILENNIGK
jgi:hypothetical protein